LRRVLSVRRGGGGVVQVHGAYGKGGSGMSAPTRWPWSALYRCALVAWDTGERELFERAYGEMLELQDEQRRAERALRAHLAALRKLVQLLEQGDEVALEVALTSARLALRLEEDHGRES
jgi:hypothetical protein